jgi:rfaE bifunctional protein kinase chain/domain/rfaE bifunctional protein nucleotidyltransferase chain/domain
MTGITDITALVRAREPRVTVVGDVILDRWLRGAVQRMSREAPVPVVEVGEPESCAGGAANTAVNLASLGARVRLVTVLGDDAEGRELLHLLAEAGVDTSAVVVRPGVTASKTRIVGADQIIVRVDHIPRSPLPPETASRFLDALPAATGDDTLIVCDYGAGLFDDSAIGRLAQVRSGWSRLIVDAHDVGRWAPVHADVITPNASETASLLGRRLPDGAARTAAVASAAGDVLAASGAAAAVVTLDRDGTVVIEGGDVTERTHAHPAPEHQASGAGDTFAAALAVAQAVGLPLPESARFAQAAADIVVARPGTAVCSLADLEQSAAGRESAHTLGLDDLRDRLAGEREAGRRIVFTNGCFDVIHRGHTTHLRQAKNLGDVLVVALNDDDSVRRLKGPERPVNTVADRTAVLEALDCVDYVVVFSEDTPIALLTELRPDIYAKGGDYTPEMLEETEVVRGYGGEVRILDYIASQSTTEIVNRIRSNTLRA